MAATWCPFSHGAHCWAGGASQTCHMSASRSACVRVCGVWALTLPVAGQVRHWEGAEALDGIDTLLVHLLADADSAAALESFAAAPNEVCCAAS